MWWFRRQTTDTSYTEELLINSQNNFQGFILLTLKYYKEQGSGIKEYLKFLGKGLEQYWTEYKEESLNEILFAFAKSITSMGGKCIEDSGSEDKMLLKFIPFISTEGLESMDLTIEEFDVFWTIFDPLFEYLGIKGDWQRDVENLITLTITK